MSADRKPLSKRVRFEVFKRDSFTCQYCGAKAPEAVLHCDHIKPVAEGGATEILNLVTACVTCNLGKGARLLDDMSVVERQRRQIEELEERRQQLEMILQWRDGLEKFKADEAGIVSDAIAARSKFVPNERGQADLRRWIKKYGVSETLAAMDEAFDAYLTDDESETWNKAFGMIARMLSIRQQEKDDPNIRRLLYIQGIIRARWRFRSLNCLVRLRSYIDNCGITLDQLEGAAKRLSRDTDWAELDRALGLPVDEETN